MSTPTNQDAPVPERGNRLEDIPRRRGGWRSKAVTAGLVGPIGALLAAAVVRPADAPVATAGIAAITAAAAVITARQKR